MKMRQWGRVTVNRRSRALPVMDAATPSRPLLQPVLPPLRICLFLLAPAFALVLSCTYRTQWFLHTTGCVAVALSGFWLTYCMIPPFAELLQRRGLEGKDLNKQKKDARIVPESLGLVAASVFMMSALFCQCFFSDDPAKLLEYSSGLLSVCCMTFLGFADDVIDLRWRYKMGLPLAAALPLVVMYRGPTTILVPPFLRAWVGTNGLFDLGIHVYRFYMLILTCFCTNSINIYAGINGIEAGQSIIMCAAVIIHNLLELLNFGASTLSDELHQSHVRKRGVAERDAVEWCSSVETQHFFSLLFSLPFFACTLALLCYNWYPAAVFVGDTYTCFAGVYFAVVGILGHFSKTLLFLFLPQIINFTLSLPQLLGIVVCPRHRLPQLDEKTGLLRHSPNFTLINLTLYLLGPMREDRLCTILLVFQTACCVAGLLLRYKIFAYWGIS